MAHLRNPWCKSTIKKIYVVPDELKCGKKAYFSEKMKEYKYIIHTKEVFINEDSLKKIKFIFSEYNLKLSKTLLHFNNCDQKKYVVGLMNLSPSDKIYIFPKSYFYVKTENELPFIILAMDEVISKVEENKRIIIK